MSSFFFLLQWLAIPLYVIAGVAIVWYIYRFFRANADLRATVFELERDLARRRRVNSVTAIIITIEFVIFVVGVQVQAVPYLEAERDLDEQIALQGDVPEDGVFITGTPRPVGDGVEFPEGTPLDGDTGLGFVPTPTLTPTPVGTIRPLPPPTEGCLDPRAQLQIPANGMIIFKPEAIRGTAFTDQFAEAKIEIRGPSTNNQYSVVDRIPAPVTQLSTFSQFVPSGLETGLYEFRLAVFDSRNNMMVASCMVNIYITDPPMTATPTPSR